MLFRSALVLLICTGFISCSRHWEAAVYPSKQCREYSDYTPPEGAENYSIIGKWIQAGNLEPSMVITPSSGWMPVANIEPTDKKTEAVYVKFFKHRGRCLASFATVTCDQMELREGDVLSDWYRYYDEPVQLAEYSQNVSVFSINDQNLRVSLGNGVDETYARFILDIFLAKTFTESSFSPWLGVARALDMTRIVSLTCDADRKKCESVLYIHPERTTLKFSVYGDSLNIDDMRMDRVCQ